MNNNMVRQLNTADEEFNNEQSTTHMVGSFHQSADEFTGKDTINEEGRTKLTEILI